MSAARVSATPVSPVTTGSTPVSPLSARSVLRHAVFGQRRQMIPSVLATMVHQACEASVPIVIGVVVDHALARHSGSGLLWSLVSLAVLFGVLTTAMRYGFRTVRNAVFQSAHELRLMMTARVLDPSGIGAEHARAGVLLSTATSDTNRVGMVNAAVWSVAGGVAGLAVTAVALLNASVVLGLVVLIGIVPVFWLTRLASEQLQRRSGVEQATAAQAAGMATDFVTGLRVLKGLGAESAAAARYAAASGRSRTAAVRAAAVMALRSGLITLLTGAFLAVVALVGGRLAIEGRISVGEFVSAIGLAQFLLGPFSRIADARSMFIRASASAQRVADVLAAPPAVPAGHAALPSPTTGELVLREVSAGPLGALNLTVPAGGCLGVVVEEPAVAVALLRCLGREIDPDSGVVELDGVPLTTLDADTVRRAVLVAWHDAVLFAGTVAENVAALIDPDAASDTTSRALAAAIEAADVDQIAAVLPDGLQTRVTERGRSLSGGQHQRVALARALAADPAVLVLHEPTTAVDAVTEARIAERLRALRTGRTTVLVSSSPSLLAVTDRVVLLGAGGVLAEGTHDELVNRDADYRELVLA
jgi:putative ABC transport system ATP-binding protein